MDELGTPTVGHSWGRTLVVRQSADGSRAEGDILIGIVDTRAIASLIVESLNESRRRSVDFDQRWQAAVMARCEMLGSQDGRSLNQ